MKMIDPPSGWKYDFPKPFTISEGQSVTDWLLENGYPQHEIDQFPSGLSVRIWDRPDPPALSELQINAHDIALAENNEPRQPW